MSNPIELLKRLAKDEEGTALLEYTILLSIVAIVAIAAATAIGAWVGPQWTALCNALPGSANC